MNNLLIEDEINLLGKYNLNPTELFLIRLILLAKEYKQEDYLFSYMQLPIECRGDIRAALEALQNKGIILKEWKLPSKGERFEPTEIPFKVSFINEFHRTAKTMGKELFDAYPQFAHIQGKVVAIKSVSKKFNSLEDAFRFYGKSIRWNNKTHQEILELVDWAKNNTNEFINCSFSSFIIDQRWNDIKALRDGNIANVNFDAIQMI